MKVFVAHAYSSRFHGKGLGHFREQILKALELAESLCNSQGVRLSLEPQFASRDFGEQLPGLVRESLESCSLGLVDLSGLRPNVLYESGYLCGLGRPVVFLMKAGTKLPADLTDTLAAEYSSADDLPDLLAQRLASSALEAHGAGFAHRGRAKSLWFPYAPPVIALVCAREHERSPFASRDQANYLFLDNLEDRDTLYEVSMYLSRCFPGSRIDRYASDAISPDALLGDLVVIGGPGEPGGPGNEICRDVLRLLKVSISFSDECDRAVFRGREFIPEFDGRHRLVRDYGYFLRDANPFNKDRTVIVVCGVHTAGTLGAALAFSDHPQAAENAKVVRRVLEPPAQSSGRFETFFPVEVQSGGAVACPRIVPRNVVVSRKSTSARKRR